MLIPLEWLSDYVELSETPEALAERLTMAGVEVEEVRGGGNEVVLDLKVTPNRGDCLSVVGVAREVAALTGAVLRPPAPAARSTGPPAEGLRVDVEGPELCPRYVARLVRNVRHGASPEWLHRRLALAGMRPISLIVDITNYVMLDLGQPLHAFDWERLAEGRIVVRRGRSGERLVIIDGTEVAVDEQMLVIADAERPVALAGVMGGAESEVTPATRHVLLESAHFDPATVRRTARRVVNTAASYRFERTVDPAGPRAAADRAAQLMVEIAGGELSETVCDTAPDLGKRAPVRFRPDRARRTLGAAVTDSEMERSLTRLGIGVERNGDAAWTATPPSWRPDLVIEEDLAEEVARLHGYAAIPSTLPGGIAAPGRISAEAEVMRRLREQFLAAGCYEALTHSLVSRAQLERLGLPESPIWPAVGGLITLRNPLSEEWDTLRPSLLPGLLATLQRNLRRGVQDAFLFEIGWVHRLCEGRPEQRRLAAAVLHGSRWSAVWNADPGWRADFYAAKGLVECLARALRLPPLVAEPHAGNALFHSGRSALLRAEGRLVAVVGELSPEAAGTLDLPRGVCLLECDVEAMVGAGRTTTGFEAPSPYPAVLRDLAVVVPPDVLGAQVEALIRVELAGWLRDVRLFDLYRGKPLAEGHASIAFALRLGVPDRTLTDVEVDELLSRLTERLRADLGAEIRSG